MDEMDCLANFSLAADARQLPIFFDKFELGHLGHKHVFFQCPWDGWSGQTRRLLQDTTISAAKIQRPGDLLLFGLRDTRKPPLGQEDPYKDLYKKYEDEYDVPALHKIATSHGYKSLQEDKDLIKHCLRFGYRHFSETGIDLHCIMLKHKEFIVYAFVKIEVGV